MWRDIKGFEGRYQMSEDREEAENKYRELYDERQKRIDASSKVFTINS